MNPNEKIEQRRVVVDSPGERREIVTERSQSGPGESSVSAGTVALIAVLAVIAVGVIFYLVSKRNANLDVASQANTEQAPPTTIVQQPAQPGPLIIQQPSPAQQAPVIIQQPAQPNSRDSASDDANMQEVATKRLTDETDMASVSITISDAQAVLSGTVNSAAAKARAERLVKAVRGVKSVENKIIVLNG